MDAALSLLRFYQISNSNFKSVLVYSQHAPWTQNGIACRASRLFCPCSLFHFLIYCKIIQTIWIQASKARLLCLDRDWAKGYSEISLISEKLLLSLNLQLFSSGKCRKRSVGSEATGDAPWKTRQQHCTLHCQMVWADSCQKGRGASTVALQRGLLGSPV